MATYQTEISEEQYRAVHHVGDGTSIAQVDQWVDWGGHTIQVDPVRETQWIHDSHDGHYKSVTRGRQYDAQEVKRLQNWYTGSVGQVHSDFFEPAQFTSYETQGCRSLDKWRGKKPSTARRGLLPVITAMIYENKLADKAYGDIEAEMRERERTAGARLFSC